MLDKMQQVQTGLASKVLRKKKKSPKASLMFGITVKLKLHQIFKYEVLELY